MLTVVVMFLSCNRPVSDYATVGTDKELLSWLRAEAVDTLTIGTDSFVLDAYLWWNFQPSASGNEKPMIAINWLVNTDSVKIPDYIDLVKQYVIYNDSVWVSGYEDETRPDQPEYKLEKISRSGPGWGPRVYVDVISQVYDFKAQKSYYIKHGDVFVERID